MGEPNTIGQKSLSFGLKINKPGDVLHTVKDGDTLFSISKKHKVSVGDIKQVNKLSTDTIRIGQKLRIAPWVKFGPSKDELFKKETAQNDEVKYNKSSIPSGFDKLIDPANSYTIDYRAADGNTYKITVKLVEHVIKKGDNLHDLSIEYKTTPDDIITANKPWLKTDTLLQLGQILLIPKDLLVKQGFLLKGTIILMELSAYNADKRQTDRSPKKTATGRMVREGIIATNIFPYGTILKINGKVFVVDDCMNHRYGESGEGLRETHGDIYFESAKEALEFGRQENVEVEVIGFDESLAYPRFVSLTDRAASKIKIASKD